MGLLSGFVKEITIAALASKADKAAKPAEDFNYSYIATPYDTFRRENFTIKDQEGNTLYVLKPNRAKQQKLKSFSACMDIYDSKDNHFASVKAYNTYNHLTLKQFNEFSSYLKFTVFDNVHVIEEAESNREVFSKDKIVLKNREMFVHSEGIGLKHWVTNKQGEEIIRIESPLLSTKRTISMKNPAHLFISVAIMAMLELSLYEYEEHST